MMNGVLRTVLTLLMYTGVLVFFLPVIAGKSAGALLFNIVGAGMAIGCGLLRCYLTEEEPGDGVDSLSDGHHIR